MSIFGKKEMQKLVENVKISFDKVREETNEIIDFLHHFKKKQDEYDIRLKLVENQINYMPKTPSDIKKIIDQHYSYDHILSRINILNDKVETLMDDRRPTLRRLQEIEHSLSKAGKVNEPIYLRVKQLQNKLETLENRPVHTLSPIHTTHVSQPRVNQLREKIIEKVTRNSKQYVKNVILSLIQKYGNISGLNLKEMVVDEQGLCSKSSFYRLLTELEKEHPMSISWKGKEKHYIANLNSKMDQ